MQVSFYRAGFVLDICYTCKLDSSAFSLLVVEPADIERRVSGDLGKMSVFTKISGPGKGSARVSNCNNQAVPVAVTMTMYLQTSLLYQEVPLKLLDCTDCTVFLYNLQTCASTTTSSQSSD